MILPPSYQMLPAVRSVYQSAEGDGITIVASVMKNESQLRRSGISKSSFEELENISIIKRNIEFFKKS